VTADQISDLMGEEEVASLRAGKNLPTDVLVILGSWAGAGCERETRREAATRMAIDAGARVRQKWCVDLKAWHEAVEGQQLPSLGCVWGYLKRMEWLQWKDSGGLRPSS
jgi:hypothetical protein